MDSNNDPLFFLQKHTQDVPPPHIQKCGEKGHEGFPEMGEVRAIAHFLSEDVSEINLPRDVLDMKSLILNPFPNQISQSLMC